MTPIRLVGATVAGLLVGLAVAFAVIAATRPSDDELQRAALDEMGFDQDLADSPLFGPLLDQVTEKVGDRIIAETRSSVLAGVLAGVVASGLAVGIVAWVSTGSTRRDPGEPTPDVDGQAS